MTIESLREIVKSKALKVISELIESIVHRKILSLKNTFSKEETGAIKSKTKTFRTQSQSAFYKMIYGCPNFYQIIDEETSENSKFRNENK